MGAMCSCCHPSGGSKNAKRKVVVAARKKASQRAAEDLRRMAAMRAPRTQPLVEQSTEYDVQRQSSTGNGEKQAKKRQIHKRNTELLKLYGHRTAESSTLLQLSSANPPTAATSTTPSAEPAAQSNKPYPAVSGKVQQRNASERSTSSSSFNRSSLTRQQLKRTSPSPSPSDQAEREKRKSKEWSTAEEDTSSTAPIANSFGYEFKRMFLKDPTPEPIVATSLEVDGKRVSGIDIDGLDDSRLGKVTPLYGPGQIVEPHLVDSSTFGELELNLQARGSLLNSMVIVEVRSASGLVYRSAPDERPNIYVKIYLQSDDVKKVIKRKTKAYEGRDNITIDEILMFRSRGTDKIMKIMVWEDHGVLGRNSMQGEVVIDLAAIDLQHGAGGWYPLFPPYSSASGNMSPAGSMLSLTSTVSIETTGSTMSPHRLIPSEHSGKGKKRATATWHA